jgi:hypothetical protein
MRTHVIKSVTDFKHSALLKIFSLCVQISLRFNKIDNFFLHKFRYCFAITMVFELFLSIDCHIICRLLLCLVYLLCYFLDKYNRIFPLLSSFRSSSTTCFWQVVYLSMPQSSFVCWNCRPHRFPDLCWLRFESFKSTLIFCVKIWQSVKKQMSFQHSNFCVSCIFTGGKDHSLVYILDLLLLLSWVIYLSLVYFILFACCVKYIPTSSLKKNFLKINAVDICNISIVTSGECTLPRWLVSQFI